MTCSRCGREERAEANFCSHCGQVLAWQGVRAGVPPYAQLYGTRLVRPHQDRMVAGVCAGVARQYGWDVALVRIVVLLSVLLMGMPLVAYLVAWICIPNETYPVMAGVPVAPQAAGTMGR